MKLFIAKITNPQVALSIILQLSIILLSVSYAFLYPPKTDAFTLAYVRLSRQSAAAALSGAVCMKPTSASQGETKVIVAFPSAFSIAGANTSWTADTTAANLPSGATAWPGIGAGPTVVDTSTKAAIFAVTQLTSTANTYCFHFVGSTSTVGAAGNDETGQVTTAIANSNSAVIETFGWATSILSGTNGEQISVTATVSGQLTVTLGGGYGASGLGLPLGVLSSSTTVTAPYQVTATVSTNAQRGYLAWVKSLNAALNSASTSDTIPSVTGNADLSSVTGYGIFAYSTAATITSPFYTNGTGTPPSTGNGTFAGQVNSTQFDQIASYASAVSGQTFLIGTRAKPTSTNKPATDYTDTITVVVSGSF